MIVHSARGAARPQKGHVLIGGLVTLNSKTSKTPFMSLNNQNKEDKISENLIQKKQIIAPLDFMFLVSDFL